MTRQDHILIVDDDAEIRSLLGEYLRKQGYRATAVADGRAMRLAMDKSRPDVVAFRNSFPSAAIPEDGDPMKVGPLFNAPASGFEMTVMASLLAKFTDAARSTASWM